MMSQRLACLAFLLFGILFLSGPDTSRPPLAAAQDDDGGGDEGVIGEDDLEEVDDGPDGVDLGFGDPDSPPDSASAIEDHRVGPDCVQHAEKIETDVGLFDADGGESARAQIAKAMME